MVILGNSSLKMNENLVSIHLVNPNSFYALQIKVNRILIRFSHFSSLSLINLFIDIEEFTVGTFEKIGCGNPHPPPPPLSITLDPAVV